MKLLFPCEGFLTLVSLSTLSPPHFFCLFDFGRPEKGITLNIAGNNRLVPTQRMTGEDFWLLSKVLGNQTYITGTYA